MSAGLGLFAIRGVEAGVAGDWLPVVGALGGVVGGGTAESGGVGDLVPGVAFAAGLEDEVITLGVEVSPLAEVVKSAHVYETLHYPPACLEYRHAYSN